MMRQRQEFAICVGLKKWFESYDVKAWLNEGSGKFTTKISQRKPDIIIHSPAISQYIGIEVKSGDIAKDIHDASKIIDYYKDYVDNRIEYFIDDEKIEISSFAVATKYSPLGRLFRDENLIRIDDIKDDKWKRINKEKGIEPLNEFSRTHDSLRRLWAEWRRFRQKKPMPGLGYILSNVLNDRNDNPILFDMQWETFYDRSQWRVGQKLL